MKSNDWEAEYPELVRMLKARLGNKQTCLEALDAYEEVLRAIWDFAARLTSDKGARALLSRSVQLAGQDAPLVQEISIGEKGVDLAALRSRVSKAGLETPEVVDALTHLGVAIFHSFAEVTGDALTVPLLCQLKGYREE